MIITALAARRYKTVNPPPPLGINTFTPRRLQHYNYANADLNRSLGGEIYHRQDVRDWLKDESSIDVKIYPSFGLSFRLTIYTRRRFHD